MSLLSRISPNARTPLGCLLILLGVFYAYAQVGGHRFVEFDDSLYLVNNRKIIEGFTWPNLIWIFTNVDAVNWHPLTWISLFIDRELFGPHPGGYLLMNVALHGAAACLCFVAFRRATGSVFLGLGIGMIFALHPANVENAAWISSRKSVLDALFWFWGIWLYVRYLQFGKRSDLLLVFASHLLGLMSKSMHVTFPCTLWLVHLLYVYSQDKSLFSFRDAWPHIKRVFLLTLPLLAVSLYFSIITLYAQKPAMSTIEAFPIEGRIMNSVISYERYLWMFFYPHTFAPFYPLLDSKITYDLFIKSSAIVILLSLLFGLLVRKHPQFLLGWLWFLGTMVPVIGLVQVGSQSHADRYLYIPCIGLALILLSLFRLIPQCTSALPWFRYAWLSLAFVSLATLTKAQAALWKDGVTLFRHSLAVTGDCMTSVIGLSAAYARNERFEEGIAFLESKIQITNKTFNKSRLLLQLAVLASMNNKPDLSMQSLKQAIELAPPDQKTLFLAANTALDLGNLAEAEMYYNLIADAPTEGNADFSLDIMHLNYGIEIFPVRLAQKKAALAQESGQNQTEK